MMHYDTFVDTKDKRRCLFLCIGLLIMLAAAWTYLQTAFDLLSIKTNEDIIRVLKENTLMSSYLSRVVLSCISLSAFDIGYISKVLLQNLQILDLLFLVWIFIWLSGKEFRQKRKPVIWILLSYALLIAAVSGIAFHASSSLSLLEVLEHVHGIAYCIICIELIAAIVCIAYLMQYGKAYGIALQYRAEEIE